MDVTTGTIYNGEDFERMWRDEEKNLIEIQESDMTDEEKENMQVKFDGDSKLSKHLRELRGGFLLLKDKNRRKINGINKSRDTTR